MNIKLGMPEVLVLFSLFMYTNNFYFAVTAFVLGALGRTMDYLLVWSTEQKKTEALQNSADNLGTAFKDIFSGKAQ